MTPKWIERINLDPAVEAYVTGRGESGESPYSGFNPCHYTGDTSEHVAMSRKMLADCLDISDDRLIVPRQIHSSICRIIDRFPVTPDKLEGVDAIVTNLRGIAIGVSTADCVPVIAVDSEAGIIAAIHAGWRGAVNGIVENAVAEMVSLGAVPKRIKAAIGPCICVDCFEVGEEVAARFPDSCIDHNHEKPHVDLPRYVKNTLEMAGIESIITPSPCTRCNPRRYFSARALGINSGRNFTCIMLKK